MGGEETIVYVDTVDGSRIGGPESASSSELMQDRPKLMRIYWYFGGR